MILGLWSNFPLGGRKVIATVAAVLGVLVMLQIVGRAHRLPGTIADGPGCSWASCSGGCWGTWASGCCTGA